MSRVASIVPAESDILCEACGYTLNGLPEDGRCPECGKPVAESLGARRTAPAWERETSHRLAAFFATSFVVIFHTTAFYKNLATRLDIAPAKRFAQLHWMIASLLFGFTAYVHSFWYFGSLSPRFWPEWTQWIIFPGLMIGTYLALYGTTVLAAKLTNWEATYRGYRLPMSVVLRGMSYHAAHYLPVALLAFATVVGYRLLVHYGITTGATAVTYLYVLAAEVVVGAIYLFQTYWIGMRNMMYAN